MSAAALSVDASAAAGRHECRRHTAPAGAHAGATRRGARAAAGQHHARLSRSLRAKAIARAHPSRGIAAARRQSSRAEARGGADRRFPAGLRCPILVRSTGLLQALRETAASRADRRFQPERRERAHRRRAIRSRALAADADARPERRAGRGAGARVGGRADRSDRVPAPAGVPHRALRVLPLSVDRHQLSRLRPAVREASRGAARRRRARASGDGGCGVPQHGFGAEAQEASRHLEEWRAAGIHRFRLEFAHESASR